ncbi:MogA/MoaB family molybdenum cofactor biosynthesis protein [Thermorudis peleae]|uniref:MogA/MoaB family molybdenum cofactor biosynthesis protein n=1 Tax=Thermorudis peleae TaxID=1382356 RepID=UPI00056DEEAF|nr:molybdenum cofactor biosynthesis protein B [Thermorudis peleae]
MSRSVAAHRAAAPETVRCAVVTVSDSRTPETDESGQWIKEQLQAAGHAVVYYTVIPDEPSRVVAVLDEMAGRDDCDAVLFNGGTGIARRDTTYEAVSQRLEKRLDGYGELFRMLSYQEIGPAAMLSRAVAGVYRGKFVALMPGSPHAVKLAMEKLLLPELAHIIFELRR